MTHDDKHELLKWALQVVHKPRIKVVRVASTKS